MVCMDPVTWLVILNQELNTWQLFRLKCYPATMSDKCMSSAILIDTFFADPKKIGYFMGIQISYPTTTTIIIKLSCNAVKHFTHTNNHTSLMDLKKISPVLYKIPVSVPLRANRPLLFCSISPKWRWSSFLSISLGYNFRHFHVFYFTRCW